MSRLREPPSLESIDKSREPCSCPQAPQRMEPTRSEWVSSEEAGM